MQTALLSLFLAACASAQMLSGSSNGQSQGSNLVQIDDGQIQAPGAVPSQPEFPSQTMMAGGGEVYGSGSGINTSPNTMGSPFVSGTSPAYGASCQPYPTGMPNTGGYPEAGGGGYASSEGCPEVVASQGITAPQVSMPAAFEGAASKHSDAWGLMGLMVFAGAVAVGMM
ncbi:hypothetical protein FN846DRAFT_886046 [Sphaerosporella brunnea]|uniref:GPI anchored protein n=1 Tax=Sphaerosporella brunnea TaxID=1250544 RepID=A0A5J5F9M8_9PEZI|nr:hypothetical protein FN846DRAFT_886046 [Sphaerosporella brunnea]